MTLPGDDVHAHVDDDATTSLVDHHQEVYRRAIRLGARVGEGTVTTEPFTDLLAVAARTHDVAKATGAFQRYLHDERAQSPHEHALPGALVTASVCDTLGYDGPDLLVPTLAVARHHTPLPPAQTPLHYLNDLVVEFDEGTGRPERFEEIVRAIDYDEATRSVADELCRTASDGAIGWPTISRRLRGQSGGDGPLTGHVYEILEAATESEYGGSIARDQLSLGFYGDLLAAWSTLVLADKTATADIDLDRVTPIDTSPPGGSDSAPDHGSPATQGPLEGLPTETLAAEIESLGDGSRLDAIRDEAHSCVMQELDAVEHLSAPGYYTIQLPTGLGKTATGLHAAMRLRDAVDASVPVVYALPYTSIIDQTAATIQNIYDVDPMDPAFTVHHHLRPTVSRFEADTASGTRRGHEEARRDRQSWSRSATTIAKSWQADLTVTTFVQLFESILTPANTQLLKLPNLAQGVIVLDEPQALPPARVELLRDALRVLVERFGCRVILMTATQPSMFAGTPEIEPTPLVSPDRARSFQERAPVQRVEYRFHESVPDSGSRSGRPLGHERAGRLLVEETPLGDRTMAICNTVESANALADAVRTATTQQQASDGATPEYISINDVDDDCFGAAQPSTETLRRELTARVDDAVGDGTNENTGVVVVAGQLTARHRPVDRRRLLAILESFDHPQAMVILTATQVVEAGVDISFDRVYRDYAPLPNIVQAAGRCNREFERDRGTVTVWQLAGLSTTPSAETATAVGADPRSDDAMPTPPGAYIYERGRITDFLDMTTTVLRDVVADAAASGEDADHLDSTDRRTAVSSPVVAHDAVEAYYDELENRGIATRQASDVSECATDELRSFSLIEQFGEPVDVFVCRCAADRQRVAELRTLAQDGHWSKLRRALRSTADRRVSVTRTKGTVSQLEAAAEQLGETTVFLLEREGLVSDFFDPMAGLTLDAKRGRGADTNVDRLFL